MGDGHEEDAGGLPVRDRVFPGAPGGGLDRRPRRRVRKRGKVRHPLNPFRWVAPDVAWKAAVAMALWLGSLVGVDRKGTARAEDAEAKADASASIAVFAAERIDSLESVVLRLRARVYVLERAAGKDNLAEARAAIARPRARQVQRSWWSRITGG